MKRIGLLLVVVALLSPGATLAQESPKWGYIEAGYIDFDPDSGASDDGAFAGVSIGLFDHFHIMGEYLDIGGYTFWNAGGGWHGLLGDKADLFAQALWANVEVEDSNVDEDGYDLQGGVRWKIIQWFEVSGQVNWVDYGDTAGDETTVEVGALFTMFNDRFGIGARYETGDADTARVYARFNFGD